MDWLAIWDYNSAENTVSTYLVSVDGSADGSIEHLTALVEADDSGRWGLAMIGGAPEGAAEFALAVYPSELPGIPQVTLVGPVDFGPNPPNSISSLLSDDFASAASEELEDVVVSV